MRRYVIALTCALIITAPLAMSKLGDSHAMEKPTQTQEQPKGDAEAGKKLYVDNCQKCHGDKGQGNSKQYKLVSAKIVPLGSKEAQDKSDDFIRKSMTDGCCKPTNKMDKVDDPRPLTPEEVENILAFVRTLKQE